LAVLPAVGRSEGYVIAAATKIQKEKPTEPITPWAEKVQHSMLSTEELQEEHFRAGLPRYLDCANHSPLFHLVSRDESEWDEVDDPRLTKSINRRGANVHIDAMNETDLRLEVSRLETKHKRLVGYVNEFVVECERRIADLERKLKTLIP
jgi:hypothetical protein